MIEHRKVEMTVVPYVCSERDCEHWSPAGSGNCPETVEAVCEECTRRCWEFHEGPVVPWDECWLTNPEEDPCTCGCMDDLAGTDVEVGSHRD